MSPTLAFAPWTRSGIGAAVSAQPGALRAQLPIDVHVGGIIDSAAAPPVSAPPLVAQTLGPGDVLAIDPRVVIRTEPGPYAQGVPANSLVAIEFSRSDFPWMFSPLTPDARLRLQPWLMLIVVPRRPGISLRSRDNADSSVQVLTVDSASELPDLAEAWAWAHAQTVSDGTTSGRSRLVSPRRLERATSYYACLVPTFNVGRQVGLDPNAEPAGPLGPAWTTAAVAGSFDLPVYYAWSFATGEAGDFHDLIAKLHAQPLPAEAGWRPLSIDFPTTPAPAGFHPFTAPLEGVLRNLADPPAPSDPAAAASIRTELLRVTGLPRTVAPPRYGQAQAVIGAPWLADLNANPVARIAAATGTRVVQARQEELVAEAWNQAAEMQRANQQRRQADAALAVGDALMRRHLAVMPPNRVFQVAAQTGVPTGGSASAAAIVDVPPTTLSATFRRLQRRTGSLARRSAVASTGSGIGMMALPPSAGPNAMSVIDRTHFGMTRPELFPAKAAVIPFPEGDGTPSGRTNAHANFSFKGLIAADPDNGIFKPQTVTTTVTLSGASVPWRLDDTTQFDTGSDPTALFIRQQTAINFKGAALAIQHYLHDTMMARAGTMVFFRHIPPADVDVDAARAQVLAALSPARALVARVNGGSTSAAFAPRALRLGIRAAASEPPSGPVALAALRLDPSFSQGMYSALADLAPDLFLVGADRVPDNSVGLVRTNSRFIEAYLAGLNHEMGRELVWRGYPSDGRGTYFRRFWDSDNYPAMTAWGSALGANVPAPDYLVLLIRGEFVRRFPGAAVFAQRGILRGTAFIPAPEPRHLPRFRVTLGGDLLCVGFDITRTQAFDFFFGIEEQITEPRFAAPPVTAFPGGPYVKLSDLALASNANAGDVAAATLRRPVRVLIDPHVLIPS